MKEHPHLSPANGAGGGHPGTLQVEVENYRLLGLENRFRPALGFRLDRSPANRAVDRAIHVNQSLGPGFARRGPIALQHHGHSMLPTGLARVHNYLMDVFHRGLSSAHQRLGVRRQSSRGGGANGDAAFNAGRHVQRCQCGVAPPWLPCRRTAKLDKPRSHARLVSGSRIGISCTGTPVA